MRAPGAAIVIAAVGVLSALNVVQAGPDPRGRQVLMVFKSDRIVHIQPGNLDSARELWRDYYRLPGSPNRQAATAPATERGKERY